MVAPFPGADQGRDVPSGLTRTIARYRGRQRIQPLHRLTLPIAALVLVAGPALGDDRTGDDVRSFTFRYAMVITSLEPGTGPVHAWVPLAVEDKSQRIIEERVEASLPGQIETEPRYGNRFWHGSIESTNGMPVAIVVETTVERRSQHKRAPKTSAGLTQEQREAHRLFLEPNQRVVVDHPILAPIQKEIHSRAPEDDKAATSRAIYDWVVDNVEYKKVSTGWGNGDTFWACSSRYGNCTDFHALFISLARSEDIPARFEMGFPIPTDRDRGAIGGYHCWVEFYLPETGWFPIDASEAHKHPSERDLLYGGQPNDRIHFTTGRDIRLGSDHQGPPLNYFIYPYIEIAGEPWTGEVTRSFNFRETAAAGGDGRGEAPSQGETRIPAPDTSATLQP